MICGSLNNKLEKDRYATIDPDDDDQLDAFGDDDEDNAEAKGLEWAIENVPMENDNEHIINNDFETFAQDIIAGSK
jgi:thiamine pyrophosphokinase